MLGGIPILLTPSIPGFNGCWRLTVAGGGGSFSGVRSLPSLMLLEWSTPAVFLMEGLSAWGLKRAFGSIAGVFVVCEVITALAEKNVGGRSKGGFWSRGGCMEVVVEVVDLLLGSLLILVGLGGAGLVVVAEAR